MKSIINAHVGVRVRVCVCVCVCARNETIKVILQ